MFAASAESATVTAISIADPTNPVMTGTLNIAVDLATAACGNFDAESVQSVAIATPTDYANAIIAAASPAVDGSSDGYLAFYDASTLAFLGCAQAGNKPEGIASWGNKIACINEGSAFEDGSVDNEGSMTMCDVSVSGGTPSFSCSTYTLDEPNFIDYDWTNAVDCIYYGVDYGGGTNPCGYAPMLKIIYSSDATSFPGWFSGETEVNGNLNSSAVCQKWCQEYSGCDYFSCVPRATRARAASRAYFASVAATNGRAKDPRRTTCTSASSSRRTPTARTATASIRGSSTPPTGRASRARRRADSGRMPTRACAQPRAREAVRADVTRRASCRFRGTDVRLYGPTGYSPALDAEPEGGAFTDDGKYFLVAMQVRRAARERICLIGSRDAFARLPGQQRLRHV